MKRLLSSVAIVTTTTTLAMTMRENEEEREVVVVGGGVMGLASAWKLAVSGRRRVTLIDAGHAVRGSWGSSRASHLSMEDEVLLKMNLLAMDEWDRLEDEEDNPIRTSIGRIFAGPKGSIVSIAESLKKHCSKEDARCDHTIMSYLEVNKRWKDQIRLRHNDEAIYLPNGGFVVHVNRALQSLRNAALSTGRVRIIENTHVTHVNRDTKTICTDDEDGFEIRYEKLVLCAGPWTNSVLKNVTPKVELMPIVVSEEQTLDIAVDTRKHGNVNVYEYDKMPLFTWSEAGYKGAKENGKVRYFYCVPSSFEPGGMKIGFHRQGALLKNENEFVVSEKGLEAISSFPHDRKNLFKKQSGKMDEYNRDATEIFVRQTLPGLDPQNVIVLMRCLYQMSKDRQMILGSIQEDKDIFVACGFSGGGFQHAPVIGAFIADSVNHDDESNTNNSFLLLPSSMRKEMKEKFNPYRETLHHKYK